jgi:hypothetical protein
MLEFFSVLGCQIAYNSFNLSVLEVELILNFFEEGGKQQVVLFSLGSSFKAHLFVFLNCLVLRIFISIWCF